MTFDQALRLLELSPADSLETAKKNHRRLVIHHHPDKQPEAEREDATRRVSLINAAWDLVKDGGTRQERVGRHRGGAGPIPPVMANFLDLERLFGSLFSSGFFSKSGQRRTSRRGFEDIFSSFGTPFHVHVDHAAGFAPDLPGSDEVTVEVEEIHYTRARAAGINLDEDELGHAPPSAEEVQEYFDKHDSGKGPKIKVKGQASADNDLADAIGFAMHAAAQKNAADDQAARVADEGKIPAAGREDDPRFVKTVWFDKAVPIKSEGDDESDD